MYPVIILFFLLSCTGKEKNSSLNGSNVILFPEKVEIQDVNLSNIVSDLRYVALETNDSVLLSSIQKIIYENNRIIIYDNNYTCFLFDRNGRFISKIGKRGHGPGEYMYVRSMDVIPDRNLLFTYDHILNRVMFYNLENGDFVKAYNLPFLQGENEEREGDIRNFNYLFDNYYYADVISWQEIAFKGTLFKLEDDSVTIEKQYYTQVNYSKHSSLNSHEMGIMFRNGNALRCYKQISDTVFTIDENLNLSPVYSYEMGKYKLPYSLMFYDGKYKMEEHMKHVSSSNMLESSKYLFITYFLGNLAPEPFKYTYVNERGEKKTPTDYTGYCLWNKSTGESIFLKQPIKAKPGFKNDIDGGSIIWPQYISQNMEIVAFCDAEKFSETLMDPSNPPASLSTLLRKLQPDDNPVVIIGKLK